MKTDGTTATQPEKQTFRAADEQLGVLISQYESVLREVRDARQRLKLRSTPNERAEVLLELIMWLTVNTGFRLDLVAKTACEMKVQQALRDGRQA